MHPCKSVGCCTLLFVALSACGEPPNQDALPVDAHNAQQLTAACDVGGTWGLRITVPVRWPINSAVRAGGGDIVQYVRTERVQAGNEVTETLSVCGIELPGYTDVFGKKHRTTFPDPLFDDEKIPSVQSKSHFTGLNVGDSFTSETAVIQIGLNMPNAAEAAWPASGAALQGITDHDADNHPGVTVEADTTGDYTYPPTTITGRNPAKKFYIAVRNLSAIEAKLTTCDTAEGKAEIPEVHKRLGLQSHVLGCELVAGGECRSLNTSLLDAYQPAYTLVKDTPPTAVLQRLPAGAKCQQVREAKYPN